MTASRWLAALAPLLAVPVAAPLSAQWPIGAPTPLNGKRAELFAAPLWLGNLAYGYRIENGPISGAALLVVSIARQDTTLLGLELYPSLGPGDVLVVDSGVLDTYGRLEISHPLPGPEIPALAGLQLYAQAAVSNIAGIGATQGVLIEASLHPMLAFGSTSADLRLIDLVLGTTTPVVGLPTGAHDAVFAHGGRHLFVAGTQGLHVVDTTAAVPTAVLLGPGCSAMAWDRVHQRLYVTRQSIDAIDGDPASPTFGTVLAQTPPLPTASLHELAASADGTLLVHAPSFATERYDIDPASPSYLQPVPVPAPVFPAGAVWSALDALHVAPDGSVVSLVVRHAFPVVTELHRFDTAANVWIDHDPSTAGVQSLSDYTHPALPVHFRLHATRDGGRAFLTSGTNSARLELELGGPGVVAFPSALPPSGLTDWYVGATPTGRYMVARGVDTLFLVDVVTGALQPFATVPSSGIIPPAAFAAWR